jgi:hypothetical protein
VDLVRYFSFGVGPHPASPRFSSVWRMWMNKGIFSKHHQESDYLTLEKVPNHHPHHPHRIASALMRMRSRDHDSHGNRLCRAGCGMCLSSNSRIATDSEMFWRSAYCLTSANSWSVQRTVVLVVIGMGNLLFNIRSIYLPSAGSRSVFRGVSNYFFLHSSR